MFCCGSLFRAIACCLARMICLRLPHGLVFREQPVFITHGTGLIGMRLGVNVCDSRSARRLDLPPIVKRYAGRSEMEKPTTQIEIDSRGGDSISRRITVAFRYDDYSSQSPKELEMKLIKAVAECECRATLAVVPAMVEGKLQGAWT